MRAAYSGVLELWESEASMISVVVVAFSLRTESVQLSFGFLLAISTCEYCRRARTRRYSASRFSTAYVTEELTTYAAEAEEIPSHD